jgi:hypothetical protein
MNKNNINKIYHVYILECLDCPTFAKLALTRRPTPSRVFVVAKHLIRTDQPGRVVAVCFVAPILAKKGFEYGDSFIQAFSVILFTWDLYWLIAHPAKVANSRK